MILVTKSVDAEATRKTVQVHGQPYQLREYIGAAPLVNQPPHSTTPPHFHEHDQFQVFIAGSARLGKKRVDPLSVQFAGAHTPYGPIVAGATGVEYYTLRKRWDPGAKYMPKMRDYLVRGQQRQRTACLLDLERDDLNRESDDRYNEPTDPGCIDIIGPEPDGLLASILRVQPGQWTQQIDPDAGDGQYHVVLNGSIIHANDELAEKSCQFFFADEAPIALQAGREGATLLILRFPKPSPTALK